MDGEPYFCTKYAWNNSYWIKYIVFNIDWFMSHILLRKSLFMSTAISCWKHQFSSDHCSQATLSWVSTWMGDRLGILSAVGMQIFVQKMHTDWRTFIGICQKLATHLIDNLNDNYNYIMGSRKSLQKLPQPTIFHINWAGYWL